MLPERIEKARCLVLAHGWNSTAYQILNPGITSGSPRPATRSRASSATAARVVAGAVASRSGEVIAFLVAKPIPQRGGWLVEQIVRGRRACYGTSELLLGSAARALAA